MDGTWLFEQLTPLHAGFWLVSSFLLAVVTTGATRTAAPELEQILQLARWVMIPYLGLILGGLSPRLIGVTGLDWTAGFGIGIMLLFVVMILLALLRILLHRDEKPWPIHTAPKQRPLPQARGPQHGGPDLLNAVSNLLLLESGAQEFHWCFRRGAVWELFLSWPAAPEPPLYWAIWVGAALSLPGISIQRKPLADRLITAVILITTSVLFLYTHNFWLCWLLHLLMRLSLQWRQTPRL